MKRRDIRFDMIEQFEQSDMSAVEFAATQGISAATVRKWRKRYRDQYPEGREQELPFIELPREEIGEQESEKQPKIDIEFPCGTRIKIY